MGHGERQQVADSRHYKAFISYSHSDEKWARWLQRALEKYRPPKTLRLQHPDLPERLYPVFRDRDELASGNDLSDSIRNAMDSSEALIVICSPEAAKSHWVNEEVRRFCASGRADRVYCLMVAGSPDRNAANCAFPPALLNDADGNALHEPLAADATASGDDKRNAMLKIAAGLLRVGVDDLKRRDAQRQTRFWASVAIGAIAIAALTIGLAAYALYAKRESEIRRSQAENLISFMLGDLRKNLEPIGKLELLDAIGDQAMGYFAAIGNQGTEKEMLERAKALKQIGDVRFNQGKLEPALAAFQQALAQTEALYQSSPANNDYLFELGQAEFWVGYVAWERGRLDKAESAMSNYLKYSIELKNREPDNADYTLELSYAYSNMGSLARARGKSEKALEYFQISNAIAEAQSALNPKDIDLIIGIAEGYSWVGSTLNDLGRLNESAQAFEKVTKLLEPLHASGKSARAIDALARNLIFGADIQMNLGNEKAAFAMIQNAKSIYSELTHQDPENAAWKRNALKADLTYLSYTSPGRWTAREVGDSIRILTALNALAATDPTNQAYKKEIASVQRLLALYSLVNGDLENARMQISSSYRIVQTLASATKDNGVLEIFILVSETYGRVLWVTGKNNEAVATWKDALAYVSGREYITFGIKPPLLLIHKDLGMPSAEGVDLEKAGYMDKRITPEYTLSDLPVATIH